MRGLGYLTFWGAVVLSASPPGRDLHVGGRCHVTGRFTGTCQYLNNCDDAMRDMYEGKEPTWCNSDQNKHVVCCKDVSPSYNPRSLGRLPKRQNHGPGYKSRKKCEEYSKWKHSGMAYGKVSGKCAMGSVPLIYGGEPANPMEFPHMVRLAYKHNTLNGESEVKCGGSLISERYILTAAHCATEDLPIAYLGREGSSRGRKNSFLKVKVTQVIVHPEFPGKFYNDIALLRLARAVEFNDYLRPACLQVDRNHGEIGIATGWGQTEELKNSNDLLKTKLNISSAKECNTTYQKLEYGTLEGFVDDTMLCARWEGYGKERDRDTCYGDSGGPLQMTMTSLYCMYSIVGVTSFGIGCGIAPGVYTRVSYYVPWIESIVWPDED